MEWKRRGRAHWGRTAALDVDSKARGGGGGPSTIQASVLSATPVLPERSTGVPGFRAIFSWSDGLQTPFEPGTATGIYLTQSSGGRGFRVTVPALVDEQRSATTLRLYHLCDIISMATEIILG
jgi:hypothetical protein